MERKHADAVRCPACGLPLDLTPPLPGVRMIGGGLGEVTTCEVCSMRVFIMWNPDRSLVMDRIAIEGAR